jgi:hypothetical protein
MLLEMFKPSSEPRELALTVFRDAESHRFRVMRIWRVSTRKVS